MKDFVHTFGMAGSIFATFGKNPAKMNYRIDLTTDFIRGY
jgi:hypothetical protein